MDVSEFILVEVELKYCERCGGLWLRPAGLTSVYCPDCDVVMADFPPVKARRAGTHISSDEHDAGGEYGICCAEGQA